MIKHRILSLGAGVQSSTLLMMILDGEFKDDPVNAAIFADTGWEPRAVYEWLEYLEGVAKERGFPIIRVSDGDRNLRDEMVRSRLRKAEYEKIDGFPVTMPLFLPSPNGKASAMARRQCTADFKIRPILEKMREIAGIRKGQRFKTPIVETWQGISLDEIARCKPSRNSWEVRRYPLVDRRMTRWDCLRWMKDAGYPEPPKSACIGCPYHTDRQWRELRDSSPKEWEDVVEFDKKIRDCDPETGAFLHKTLAPIDEVDLDSVEDKGQLSLFNSECDGLCGI